MRVPQSDPHANYVAHQAEIDDAIAMVLSGGQYILGPQERAFETELGELLGTGPAVGVGCGTDALVLALRGCGVGRDDGVITVSHTSVATVAAIEMVGAIPVLVDVDPETFTLDPLQLEAALGRRAGPRVKAVVPVHLYGHPADMPQVSRIAAEHGALVIEDCAQALGACIGQHRVGSLGDAAAFSFYPTKNLAALGDGGAVWARGAAGEEIRVLREYGWRTRFVSDMAGLNSRLDELQAAVLRVKLRYLDAENGRRRTIAALYHDGLKSLPIDLPRTRPGCTHVFHQYVVRAAGRDELRQRLGDAGIGTGVHYPVPIHMQPAYRARIETLGELPVTSRLSDEIVSLPMYPEMSGRDVAAVVTAVSRAMK